MKGSSFGKRLRALRKEHKLTQAELGRRVRAHYNLIGRYERQEVWPSLPVLKRLTKVFGVSLDFLVNDKAPPRVVADKLDKGADLHLIETEVDQALPVVHRLPHYAT